MHLRQPLRLGRQPAASPPAALDSRHRLAAHRPRDRPDSSEAYGPRWRRRRDMSRTPLPRRRRPVGVQPADDSWGGGEIAQRRQQMRRGPPAPGFASVSACRCADDRIPGSRHAGLALEGAQRRSVHPSRRAAAESAAIHRIADDGVLEVRQVQANLMRAPGLELDAQDRCGRESAPARDSASPPAGRSRARPCAAGRCDCGRWAHRWCRRRS
jgi:hypothetical protein